MSESDEQLDTGSLDTEAFRAFAERGSESSRKAAGMPFRLVTLGVGLAALVAIVLLLLRM
ncbi:MAG: hypothetical protein ACRD0K_00820 [Egibacteraceae bacterium]